MSTGSVPLAAHSLCAPGEADSCQMRGGGDGVSEIRACAGDKVTHTIRHASLLEHLEHKVVGENGCVGGLPHRHLERRDKHLEYIGSTAI